MRNRKTAFTLVELLVVIGIIAVLVGILVPVVGRVRRSGYIASSKNFINQLDGAIQRYYGDFKAYPGPFSNNQIRQNGFIPGPAFNSLTRESPAAAGYETSVPDDTKVTGAENLVLGLLGGLRVGGTAGNYTLIYDPSAVGSGPSSLNPANVRRYTPYIDAVNLSWQNFNGLKTGKYGDDAAPLTSATAGGADDTIIPEFVDNFPDGMPILYARARIGANRASTTGTPTDADNGIIGTNKSPTNQYDLDQFIGYTSVNIGTGRASEDDYFNNNTNIGKPNPSYHGLKTVNTSATAIPGTGYFYPFDAYAYFQNDPKSNVKTARQKDGYVLISAGPDRIYGTRDDICSFGDVMP